MVDSASLRRRLKYPGCLAAGFSGRQPSDCRRVVPAFGAASSGEIVYS
jgi:hypothetical protein